MRGEWRTTGEGDSFGSSLSASVRHLKRRCDETGLVSTWVGVGARARVRIGVGVRVRVWVWVWVRVRVRARVRVRVKVRLRLRLGARLPHALRVALHVGPAAGLLELEQALLLLEGRHDHDAHTHQAAVALHVEHLVELGERLV